MFTNVRFIVQGEYLLHLFVLYLILNVRINCRTRGPTYVWTFNLKSREKPSKWILSGVAIILQP